MLQLQFKVGVGGVLYLSGVQLSLVQLLLQVEDGGGDVGGGADEMIYMEYLEAWGAVACFKRVNPYVPLWKRMEETFVDKLFPPQKKYALARKKKGKK